MAPSKDDENIRQDIHDRLHGSAYSKFLDQDNNAMRAWQKSVEVVFAERTSDTTGRVAYRFPVLRQYLNPARTLHGGLQAAMYDICTSLSIVLIHKPGFWPTFGTSRSLNVTYIRPAVEGEMLMLECEVVHVGKRLCLLKAMLKRERDGAIISSCEHQKYNVDADVAKA